MNLIICAAGSSNRLKKLTKKKPKSMIRIGNKMIINRVLESFNLKQIQKVFIVVGFKRELLKKNIDKKFRNKIIFITNNIYKKTGNMHSLSLAGNESQSDIVFVNADNLIEKKVIKKFILHKQKNLVLIDKNKLLFEDDDPVKVKMIKNKLFKIDKKLTKKDTNAVAVGLYKLSQNNFKKYLKISKSIFESGFINAGFVEPLKEIIKNKKSISTYFPGYFKWADIDTLDDLKNAKKLFK